MNRIEEAKKWISSLQPKELVEKVREAKEKYSDKVPKYMLRKIREGNATEKEKTLQMAKLFLVQMYLEEHKENPEP